MAKDTPPANPPVITSEAIAAIGEDDKDIDWKLAPELHIAKLHDREKAGPLIRILQRPEIGEIVAAFGEEDGAADRAQARYKLFGRLGIIATLAATLIGALFLLPLRDLLEIPEVKGGALAAQFSALALAFIAAWWLRRTKHFENWMRHRGAAEIQRIALFDKVMAIDEPVAEGELPLLPLKLEYFRRFQLDVQRRYYKGRGEEHAMGVMQSKVWRVFSWIIRILVVIIAIPSFALLFNGLGWISLPWLVNLVEGIPGLSEIAHMAEESLLAIGVMASAIHAASTARSRMDLDERNAARYLTTSDNLEFLTETDLDTARACGAAGKATEILQFVNAVQRQISSEHQEWTLLREVAPDPIG